MVRCFTWKLELVSNILQLIAGLIVPSPTPTTPFPANVFPNILATTVPNEIGRNPTFCSFDSFLIVSLILLIRNPYSSSDSLAIFIIFPISLFGNINAVVADPNIFFWIAGSVADAAAVNPNGIETLLANGVTICFSFIIIHQLSLMA